MARSEASVQQRREYARAYAARRRAADPERAAADRKADYEKHREKRLAANKARKTERGYSYPEYDREYHLKTKYGITQAEYEQMLSDQSGVCAGCGSSESGGSGVFHVDHDHTTGAVRGLLCKSCNIALGHVRDDVNVLMSLVSYLLQTQDVLVAPGGTPSRI